MSFLNDCIDKSYRRFSVFFPKEREKFRTRTHIALKGALSEAFFLDCDNHYAGFLNNDSMIMIDNDPGRIDKDVLRRLFRDNFAQSGGRLCSADVCRLATVLKTSEKISPYMSNLIRRSFNSLIASRKNSSGEIKCN